MNDPLVTVTVWRGPLSALAARQKLTPGELLRRIRNHGLQRGANWEIPVSSPTALATLARVLGGEPVE